jgi:dolichol-phosphate mannosyltransferase
MKFKTWKHGFKIVEVPIIFKDRTQGASKMSGGIFGEAFFGVIELKVASWFRKFPQKKKK